MKIPMTIVSIYLIVLCYGLNTTIYEQTPDHRVQNWFLMRRWTPIILIIMTYFLTVLIGPKLMEKRPAFTLRNALKVYNLLQVIISTYMFKEFLISAWKSSYSLVCQPVDSSDSQLSIRMAAACWWFFFSKIIDTLDTIFFILRKKNSQVTFLHVYHHGSMILNWWLGAKYTPGGQVFFQCMINSLVHAIMYSYYFLSSFGPAVQKYLWWKKYLTQLQLIQFCAIIVHLIIGMCFPCGFPRVLNYYIIIYCVTLIALFTNFYIETYRKSLKNNNNPFHRKKLEMEKSMMLNNNNNLSNGTSNVNANGNGEVYQNGFSKNEISLGNADSLKPYLRH